ncbi:MAG: Na+/H+ antiporter NhaA [Nocardioides sp.]|nr:Na+/H+ antiporter NhaA [Nocardioides sp.]
MPPLRLFRRSSSPEASWVAEVLRQETTGGLLLMGAALLALVWANSPLSASYQSLREVHVGPSVLSLHLSFGDWASDGLLAIFFFVAGLELKRELVCGDLRDPRRAVLPAAAAVGGMLVPALVYVVVALVGGGPLGGWATPMATDIAFAVAVLAVISTHLPPALRTFLLTLAVVDDLLGIIVIAVVFTSGLHLGWLALALLPLAAFAVLARRGVRHPLVLVPVALCVWGLVHASGVHATVAGVLLGFAVPVRASSSGRGPAERLEHVVRPVSAGVAVPVFAFFAAGVSVGGWSGVVSALRDPVTLGVALGLVVGKPLGITASTWLLARFTHASLDDDLAWADVVGMALLGGIGFTVSLLLGQLAFRGAPASVAHMQVGVLLGCLASALLAAVVLRARNRVYALESVDDARDAFDA